MILIYSLTEMERENKMRRLILHIALAGFLFLPFSAHAQTENSADAEELVALSNEWMQALERKDKNRLEQIIHKDFFILGMVDDDSPTNREQWLKNGIEDSDWLDFRYDNMHVTTLGDTAVVRSTLDFTAERRSGFFRGQHDRAARRCLGKAGRQMASYQKVSRALDGGALV
jgi:ketosteroid isomerase-like protein